MKIIMVGPFGFHPNKTMRSRAMQLAKPLVQRGHTVHLIMPPWHTPEEAGQQWEEEGVMVHYVKLTGGVLGITRRMIKATLATRPDVVHCFKPKAYSGLVAWWLWQFHRHSIRLIMDTDDWEGWGGWNDLAPYSPLQKRFFAWQEQWGMRQCHHLTVASRTLESLAWAHGVPLTKTTYLPNGAGIASDSSQSASKRAELGLTNRPVLLLYSRLFEFDTTRLIAILKQVHEAVPNLAILAVGAGLYDEQVADFRQQLAQAGLDKAIVDVGWIDEAKLPTILGMADVGFYLMEDTLLNRTKCPVKLADMLTVGVPVVGEAVGQVTEYVVQQHTGLLRPTGDVNGIASDLILLLHDSELRQKLSIRARAHIATNFSWNRLAERVEGVYLNKG